MPDPTQRRYSPEGVVATVVLVVMVATVLLQVAGRAGFSRPPIWTEELSRWLFVWMVFLGLPEVERTDSHLKVEVIPALLPARLRAILFTAIDVVLLGVIANLIWVGYRTVLRTWSSTAVTMPTTDAVLYAAFPIAGVFVVLRVVQRIARRLRAPGA